MSKINVAVIGVGYWGKKITSEYCLLSKENPNVNLYGVCDVFEDNLKFCKEKYDVIKAEQDPTAIMSNPEIDAVHICTPSITHYALSKAALEAGKHVLVEKPMTMKSENARQLVDLAHSKNRILSVGHIFRFDAALEKVKMLFETNYFGDLYWLKLQWTTHMPLMQGRDIITDLAPHPYDIINFIASKWPTKITCIAKAHRPGQNEETAQIVAILENNIMAHIELSWFYPGKTREVSIIGSRRSAIIDCTKQEIQGFENGQFYKIPVKKNNTIRSEIKSFVECIGKKNIADSPYCKNRNNGAVGARVVRLLEITRNSMKNERTMFIDGWVAT